ncbi:phosphomevalonate kinase [Nocardia grenadensis]|uniref:phosphomevalonate kinase n=1 Tax=Nocardia grenadensis TaxID=931537 RepID=UPI003D75CD0D
MITRRAPGKLFVAGEYAVLRPANPAVLVAVDRYVAVTIAESPSDTTVLSSDLGGGSTMRCTRRSGRLVPVSGRDPGLFGFVLAAVGVVERLLAESGGQPSSFRLTARGEGMTEGGHKLGFGSSAAVTVATVDALAAFYRLHLGRTDRYRLAMLASLAVGPNGSGGDIAASTWGGWVAYRSPDRHRVREFVRGGSVTAALRAPWPGFSVRTIPPPERVGLLVGWTGRPASTPALTARTGDRHHRIDACPGFLSDSSNAVEHLVNALADDDVYAVGHGIRRARELLYALDATTGLGIRTGHLDVLCTEAERAGAAAKPSGAGGGDCGIAVLDSERPAVAAEVTRRWLAAGIRPVPVGVHPGAEYER